MDSSAIESPLDVLSRAATMLQQEDRSKSCKPRRATVGKDTSASSQWRRDRRPCPIVTTTPRPVVKPTPRSIHVSEPMAPLDMSTRRKDTVPKLTPTRVQGKSMISPSRGSRGSQRVSVITCAPAHSPNGSASDEEVLGLDSDPVIDEHFRRSLGRDYLALFPAQTSPRTSPPPAPTKHQNSSHSLPNNVTLTGLSVDDHFAKALGETWLRLQAGEKKTEEKSKGKAISSSNESQESKTVIPLRVST